MTRLCAQDIALQLSKSRKLGDGWTACCPAHDDHNPSLSLNDTRDGRVLVHCFSGCQQELVIEALTDLGLWEVTQPQRPKHRPASQIDWKLVVPVPTKMEPPDFAALCFRQPSAVYAYTDADGQILSYLCRVSAADGRKEFIPFTCWEDDQGRPTWRKKALHEPRPLYGLRELALRPDAPVLIVEGEKAADAAKQLLPLFAVITWPNGARSVDKADWSPLRGRTVVIWPDNDEPGRLAAQAVSQAADKAGALSAAIVTLPSGLPDGWDLADEIQPSLDIQSLVTDAARHDPTLARFVVTAREMRRLDIPRREYLITPFLPECGLAMLFAKRGVGKTWWVLTMALALARGENFLGYAVSKARRVLFIDGEMALADLKERLSLLGGPDTDNLMFLSSETLAGNRISININNRDDQIEIDAALARLERDGRRPDLIILDNLSSLGRGLDENDNSALDGQLAWLVAFRHRRYAVMIVHHAGKSGEQRGASRREDLLDTVVKLDIPQDDKGSRGGAAVEQEFTKVRGIHPDPMKMYMELRQEPSGRLQWFFARSVNCKPRHRTLQAIYEGCKELDGRARPFRSQDELCGAITLSKGAISQHVNELKREGLVWREPGALLVSPKGVEALQQLFGSLPEQRGGSLGN